jgi:uncharacterized protein YdeI (YjbR/CyaY-like superfamily)
MVTKTHKDLPVLLLLDEVSWLDWLKAHYATQPKGVWLAFAKKGSGCVTITYEQARDTALCYGWIDSIINGFDSQYYLTKFTPRRPKSVWSLINVGVVERLIAEGRMHASGMAEVAAAQADGRWERAYPGQSQMVDPPDLLAALAKWPEVLARYQALTKGERYSILFPLHQLAGAKREENIEKIIAKLAATLNT